MARVHDLIEKVSDPALREALAVEIKKLEKNKKFGLVFEEHLPEAAPLPGVPVRAGMTVATVEQDGGALYRVVAVDGDKVKCVDEVSGAEAEFARDSVVAVAKFGEPIYPYLEKVDEIEHGGGDLWHALIQADNYHALQLLEYLYPGQVDCIYIDPPYNTGAKDWKYNNDYVDGNDGWRHSKWLSMMEHRLRIAKRLLNPKDSVLIVTIDEKEYLHLGMLLEQMFPEARIQMVSTIIKPEGTNRANEFSRTNEYLYFVMFGDVEISASETSMFDDAEESDQSESALFKESATFEWRNLRRREKTSVRTARPNQFYPIFVSKRTGFIHSIGDAISPDVDRRTIVAPDGCYALFPLDPSGGEKLWGKHYATARLLLDRGYLKIENGLREGKAVVKYLPEGVVRDIENGKIKITDKGLQGEVIGVYMGCKLVMPKTIWNVASHNAQTGGSLLIKRVLADNRFTFPKSLYAVHDAIRFFVAEKPNSIIVDFFAGSGTTLHAVNLLNAEDGGKRRCILVTNNEISADEAKEFRKRGLKPGDPEWEAKGIAQYVTWPRTTCSIRGVDVKGAPLKGDYIGGDKDNPRHMADGFQANAAFFKLGFQDPTQVALGRQFKEILPTLWMKAGAHGKCPVAKAAKDMLVFPENRMAILFDESAFASFKKQVRAAKTIETVYIVTDYAPAYRSMARAFPGMKTYSLYRNYLDSFRINVSRS